jgi:hypothetical protein
MPDRNSGTKGVMKRMTIGELISKLQNWPKSCKIVFGCKELEFHRLKARGSGTVQLEFNQNIWKDTATGQWHIDEHRRPLVAFAVRGLKR